MEKANQICFFNKALISSLQPLSGGFVYSCFVVMPCSGYAIYNFNILIVETIKEVFAISWPVNAYTKHTRGMSQ